MTRSWLTKDYYRPYSEEIKKLNGGRQGWKLKMKNEIIHFLYNEGACPRNTISKGIRICRSSCYDYLSQLERDEIVTRYPLKITKGPGKPHTFWELTKLGEKIAKGKIKLKDIK